MSLPYKWTTTNSSPNRRRTAKDGDILRSGLNPSRFWIWRARNNEWEPFHIKGHEDITVPEHVVAPLTSTGYMRNPFHVSAHPKQ